MTTNPDPATWRYNLIRKRWIDAENGAVEAEIVIASGSREAVHAAGRLIGVDADEDTTYSIMPELDDRVRAGEATFGPVNGCLHLDQKVTPRGWVCVACGGPIFHGGG